MRFDAVNSKKLVSGLVPLGRTADATAEFDLQNSGSVPTGVLIGVYMGAEGITLSGTDKIDIVVTHGDSTAPTDPVVAADVIVPASQASAIVTAPDANGKMMIFDGNADIPGIFWFGYVGGKRYVDVKADYSGTHGAATPLAVFAIYEGLPFQPA